MSEEKFGVDILNQEFRIGDYVTTRGQIYQVTGFAKNTKYFSGMLINPSKTTRKKMLYALESIKLDAERVEQYLIEK